ncbi:MAG: tetratricopeptide repeat protein [bacterium]
MAIDREAMVAQANRMQEAGLYEVAASLYKKITDDAPDDVANAPIYIIIGDLLLLAGKREDAAAAYLKADQLQPSPDVRDKLEGLIEETAPVEEPAAGKKKIHLPNMPTVKMPTVNMPHVNIGKLPDAEVVGEQYNKFHSYVNTPQRAKMIVRITIAVVVLALFLFLFEPWNWFFKKGGNWQPVAPQKVSAPKGFTPGGR